MDDQSVRGELPFRVREGVAKDKHVHTAPPFHSRVIFAGEAHAALNVSIASQQKCSDWLRA